MATDDRFGAATPDLQRIREQCRTSLLPTVCSGELPVLGGFVGAGPSGKVTTLGRGGSDTTAAVLGLALEAEEVQIWTDVDGLMSADPRLVPSARTLSRVSFAEAAELSLYGARVLHPDAIAPAVRRSIPVRVLNSLRPEGEGTLVVGDRTEQDVDEAIAVASRDGISLARLLSRRLPMEPGLPRQALAVCAEAGIAPQLVLSSAATVGLVAERSPALQALQRLDSLAEVTIEEDCAIACVVGAAVTRVPQLRERIMAELAAAAPELIATDSQGASIVAVVREAALASTVRRLHEAFVERGATR